MWLHIPQGNYVYGEFGITKKLIHIFFFVGGVRKQRKIVINKTEKYIQRVDAHKETKNRTLTTWMPKFLGHSWTNMNTFVMSSKKSTAKQ